MRFNFIKGRLDQASTLYRLTGQPVRRPAREHSPGLPALGDREGLRLVLSPAGHVASVGNMAWGEAWPLPGWSRESVKQLQDLLGGLAEPRSLAQWWALAADPLLPPSFAWALSAACWRVRHRGHDVRRQVASLCTGSAEQVRARIFNGTEGILRGPAAARPSPPQVIKVKVSGWQPSDVIELCLQAQLRLWNLQLRLDANQSWQPQQVLEVMQHPSSQVISYWEEPTPEEYLLELAAEGVPVALDESLRNECCSQSLRAAAVAWIWKPTLSGSLERLLVIRQQARLLGKPLVLSSCFEGAHTVGLFMELADPNVIHGLDPYRLHQADGPLFRSGPRLFWRPTRAEHPIFKKNG